MGPIPLSGVYLAPDILFNCAACFERSTGVVVLHPERLSGLLAAGYWVQGMGRVTGKRHAAPDEVYIKAHTGRGLEWCSRTNAKPSSKNDAM
jgi:hypothetical protein